MTTYLARTAFVLGLLGLNGLAGCAGVVPEPPRMAEPRRPAAAPERVATLGPVEQKSALSCSGGQMVRSAYYWQGRHTASGQPFDPEGMTAAHRTLPFGTKLTVTNPRTGKSVVVVVNDRGPFTRGLNLDLSRGAARAIGLTGTGAVCVS
jgi:rare lipoprotein A